MRTWSIGLAAACLISCLPSPRPQPDPAAGEYAPGVEEVAYAPVGELASSSPPAVALVSDASLRAALDAGIVAAEDGELEVDSFVMMLVVEELAVGSPLAPSFTRVEGGDGYRVSGVAAGSIYARLGLRDGDVITAINGVPLTSPGRALMASGERSRRAAISLERDGVAFEQTLRIRSEVAWRNRRGPSRAGLGGLFRSERDHARARPFPASDEEPEPSSPARDERAPEGAAEAIRCEPDGLRCTIDRAWLRGAVTSETMLKQARVLPSTRDGEVVGFKLYAIRHGSIPYLLGIKNGDLITRINGRALTSADAVMELWQQLEELGAVEVIELALERRGQPTRLRVELR